jgi:hypothetical protein
MIQADTAFPKITEQSPADDFVDGNAQSSTSKVSRATWDLLSMEYGVLYVHAGYPHSFAFFANEWEILQRNYRAAIERL